MNRKLTKWPVFFFFIQHFFFLERRITYEIGAYGELVMYTIRFRLLSLVSMDSCRIVHVEVCSLD